MARAQQTKLAVEISLSDLSMVKIGKAIFQSPVTADLYRRE